MTVTTMVTWNLYEERRERKEKDHRHTPQVQVARRADFRRHLRLRVIRRAVRKTNLLLECGL